MKTFIFILLLMTPLAAFADSVEDEANIVLKEMDVKYIQHTGTILRIVLSENNLTDRIYKSTIINLCRVIPWKPLIFSKLTEIQVLNVKEINGYAFKCSEQECKELKNLPVKMVEYYIVGKTNQIKLLK